MFPLPKLNAEKRIGNGFSPYELLLKKKYIA
jgi:hypothetical protein